MRKTQNNEKFAYYSILGSVNELLEKSNRNIHALVRGIQPFANSTSVLLANGTAAWRNGTMCHRPTSRLAQAHEIPMELRQPAVPLYKIRNSLIQI
ncbi:MAG: hypothetical protein PHR06_07730 [Candidatus Cloacimonetes bacterium]|nr:hypothetical protein [Candidatus Cloacimonadota bacterium]